MKQECWVTIRGKSIKYAVGDVVRLSSQGDAGPTMTISRLYGSLSKAHVKWWDPEAKRFWDEDVGIGALVHVNTNNA